MTIADYIIKVLRTQIMIVLSWGFHNAKPIEDGIAFLVEGYKFKGRVEIVYDEGWDLFNIRLVNEDGTLKEQAEGVYVDGLVSTIDLMVEKTPDYKERVKKQYSL
jgi:hypothetical protein